MKFTLILFALACAAWQTTALAQDDSEPRAIPPRGLLKRGQLAKGKTTTTTTPPPLDDQEYVDESEYPIDGEEQEGSTEAPPSSTEGKKLVAGGIRPFRSNTDLLETLKRRRAQALEAKLHGTTSSTVRDDSPTEAPVKANFNGKKRFSSPKESSNDEVAAASKPTRSRFGRPSSSKAIQEPEKEEQLNDAAPAPQGRTGRTFRRGSY